MYHQDLVDIGNTAPPSPKLLDNLGVVLSVSNAELVVLISKFRFLCCQEQLLFLCDALNIIDLLDLLIFVAYAITRSLAIQQYGPERHFLISIMHKTRLLCVARLFKLCRHSRGLRLVFQIFERILLGRNPGQSG